MSAVDFAKAKSDIASIVEIVKTVPEALQQRCFELLFELAFVGKTKATASERAVDEPEKDKGKGEEANPGAKKLPSNVLAFAHRQSVTREQIAKLFMFEHDPLLAVYKIDPANTAKAQLTKVMMVILENGLLNNSLSAPFTELREAVRDDGFMDKNFNRNLRHRVNLFKGAVKSDSVDESGTVELTGEGMAKLAEIVKEMTQ